MIIFNAVYHIVKIQVKFMQFFFFIIIIIIVVVVIVQIQCSDENKQKDQ